ncbi:hypothetical protein NDU88_007912 [Pleurodeles waltl]|uniref:Uncharacterized protein n=1 Tax=Pleurodeles waltl TaxID=8319 RepID=A0AAV7RUC4_PLEWA|nr:hypothetical protein NDU88_007912 [Pleurodeles waltl]
MAVASLADAQQEPLSPSTAYRTILISGSLRCLVVGRQASNQVHALTPPSIMADPVQGATMECILQEISAMGRRLEGMDNAMASLTAETKSMHMDIAGFQSRVLGLEQ